MDGWVDAAVSCSPLTLYVFGVAALSAARAFAVFKPVSHQKQIKCTTSGHIFQNKMIKK